MLKRFLAVLLVLLTMAFPFSAYAFDSCDISAECAAVMDASTHTLLFEKNAYLKHSMASTTKIMTCLIACESGRLGEKVTITQEMLNGVEGTSLYLKAGDEITLGDLVKGAMLESGNDAANAIAIYLSGGVEPFCALMNEKAKALGMNNTNFVTPSGLDEKLHYSSAYDMALLGSFAASNQTLMDIAQKTSDTITISGQTKTLNNHNKLLSKDKGYIGLKTGFTKKSGRCLVTVKELSGSRLVCVTLNAPDDWEDHIKLAEYAEMSYNTAENEVSLSVNAVGSVQQSLNCSYSYSLKVCGQVYTRLYYYPFVYAPVKAGDVIGRAEIYIGENMITAVDITASEDINNGG